jgi:hypothetical protein
MPHGMDMVQHQLNNLVEQMGRHSNSIIIIMMMMMMKIWFEGWSGWSGETLPFVELEVPIFRDVRRYYQYSFVMVGVQVLVEVLRVKCLVVMMLMT